MEKTRKAPGLPDERDGSRHGYPGEIIMTTKTDGLSTVATSTKSRLPCFKTPAACP